MKYRDIKQVKEDVEAGTPSPSGFVTNIEADTIKNSYFRKVIYTTNKSQLVLMSIEPKDDIGVEVHKDVDQFLRIEEGEGFVELEDTRLNLVDGSAIVVPAGVKHNVINTGSKPLKLYALYTPPHHEKDTIHKTKEDAKNDDEHFTGKTNIAEAVKEENFGGVFINLPVIITDLSYAKALKALSGKQIKAKQLGTFKGKRAYVVYETIAPSLRTTVDLLVKKFGYSPQDYSKIAAKLKRDL